MVNHPMHSNYSVKSLLTQNEVSGRTNEYPVWSKYSVPRVVSEKENF